MQAIAMVAQILQRHVHAMQSSPPCHLAIDSAPEHAAAELPGPQQLVDNETMRQDIMRALFAEPAERCVSPPPLPSAASTPVSPLPVFPTSLVRPGKSALQLRADAAIVAADCAHDACQLLAPAKPSPPPVCALARGHAAVHAPVHAAAALRPNELL